MPNQPTGDVNSTSASLDTDESAGNQNDTGNPAGNQNDTGNPAGNQNDTGNAAGNPLDIGDSASTPHKTVDTEKPIVKHGMCRRNIATHLESSSLSTIM